MLVDLKGRHALVTGGGTGIGSALCIGLARCGATVVVNYSRSEKGAEETVESIKAEGGRAIAVKADLTDEDQVEQLVDTSLREFGGLHILVANAGGPTEHKPTVDLEEEDWNRGMGINCKSVFYCVKHTVPHLPDTTGRIIVNSSGSARSSQPTCRVHRSLGRPYPLALTPDGFSLASRPPTRSPPTKSSFPPRNSVRHKRSALRRWQCPS